MTIYCIAQARNVDGMKLKEYQQYAGDALRKHDGMLVGKSNKPEALETTSSGHSLSVILSFPSEDKARAWRDDPDLASVHDLRNASGDWTIDLLRQ